MTDPKPYVNPKTHTETFVKKSLEGKIILTVNSPNHDYTTVDYDPNTKQVDVIHYYSSINSSSFVGQHFSAEKSEFAHLASDIKEAYKNLKNHPQLNKHDDLVVQKIITHAMSAAKKDSPLR